MHYNLGVDQTLPSALLVVDPTDVQKVAGTMAQLIRDQYPQFLNVLDVNLVRKVGVWGVHGPILLFLSRLLSYERLNKKSLVRLDSEYFVQFMGTTYKYDPVDLGDYVTAYITALEGGSVPKSISEPWDYQPTTFLEDVTEGAGTVTKKLWPIILGVVAVYAGVKYLIPKLILR